MSNEMIAFNFFRRTGKCLFNGGLGYNCDFKDALGECAVNRAQQYCNTAINCKHILTRAKSAQNFGS